MRKNKKKEKVQVIDSTDLLIHSKGKIGRHEPEVKTGCGPHKSLKDYKRNPKHKKSYQEE